MDSLHPKRSEVLEADRLERRTIFLSELRKRGNVRDACVAAGINDRSGMYKLRNNDADFARDWDDAMAEAADALESEAHRRGVEGVIEEVFYQGDVVGYVERYSDSLLMMLLKGAKPEKYRERIEHSGSVDLTARILAGRKRAALG